MKKILIVLLAITCQMSFSQAKKKSVPPPPKREILTPPKVKIQPYPSSKPMNTILGIVKDNSTPLCFKFEINKDTIILPNEEFAEVIEIQSNYSFSEELSVAIISKSAADTLKFEHKDNENADRIMYRYFEKRKWCEAIVAKETIKATDKETKLVTSFKVVVDKTKKKILYLENVATKRKYLPTDYEAPSPSIGF